VRLYDTLFSRSEPGVESGDFRTDINPRSLEVLASCFAEPGLAAAEPGCRYQFERMGYFCVDPDSTRDKLIFNRIVSLKDTWAKIEKGKK
jgi:glutaminyl-tRNA synthetase